VGLDNFVEAMAKRQNKSKQTIEKEFFEHVRPSSALERFAMVDEVAAMATVGSSLPALRNIARLDCSCNASRRIRVYAFSTDPRSGRILTFVALVRLEMRAVATFEQRFL
jgi:hypothetical protein